MSALQGRVGTKIKAVLTILHKGGYDVGGIERQAENAMRRGQPAAPAYEAAVGAFLRGSPAMKPTLERVTKLIDQSDAATVAKYEHALSAYITNRDETAMDALEPMMRADLTAMAVRSGELSVEDAGAGRVDWAGMGMPGLAGGRAVEAGAALASPAPAPQTFAFASGTAGKAVPQTATRTTPAPAFANQAGAEGSITGYRTPGVAARWDAALLPTYSKPSPYAGMSPGQIRDAYSADASAPRGWVEKPNDI
ncbi:hypothetical protein ASE95_10815 [Sphingomonas sp. Leaf231]|uniref:hypothetical protein n=1 Tax=Sphingomonas sp. Leaf231 TaxID=1736301 RepID=UPI0006FD3CBF|nr:hypothetical protein [Sphingomonas sp. Leaf231]KQN93065.1 hypothetical protein ASE95_10815 [Sphingomonas sp. Leaf231]